MTDGVGAESGEAEIGVEIGEAADAPTTLGVGAEQSGEAADWCFSAQLSNLREVSALERLDLRDASLAVLPLALSACAQLVQLDVSGNRALASLEVPRASVM
jgi:hypothetical protein